MAFSPWGALVIWTLVLWLLGWLSLPVSRRVFAGLPDGGLAAGRFAFIVIVALVAFWGAALHLVPLSAAPALAVAAALWSAWSWRAPQTRDWARQNWRALLVSDAVFLVAWAVFLWVRWAQPEAGDLEKPMDIALMSAAWKTQFLPFQNPWFAGENFTNYYYFGPMMGALMARGLGAAPQLAYNLVQPAFCAFFLSILWSLGAALTRSNVWGVAAMLLVGGSGPLEPLRQISQKGWSWPFDWFSTSRVIPNTINEYPAFTLTIGDAHAHFYALSLAALWLCLCWSLFAPNASRRLITGVCGAVLGAWLMTNTWDAPIFALILGGALWFSRPTQSPDIIGRARAMARATEAVRALALWGAALALAIAVASPYFARFHSPGLAPKSEFWRPDALSFVLLWGGWIGLLALAFLLPDARGEENASVENASVENASVENASVENASVENAFAAENAPLVASIKFRRVLLCAGVVALWAPFAFYIRGAFGDGPLRHQDTVFKFGLQAWILLGVGISAELGARWRALKTVPRGVVTLILLALSPLIMLAPATVIWARAVEPSREVRAPALNAMRFLPAADREAIMWLQANGRAGEAVMEAVKFDNGALTGDYDAPWGRVGAFSGLSSTLGWPQHVWGWGTDYGQVQRRAAQIAGFYAQPALEAARGGASLGARYTFFGASNEGAWQTPSDEAARAAGFAVHLFAGEDGSRALILERIGR